MATIRSRTSGMSCSGCQRSRPVASASWCRIVGHQLPKLPFRQDAIAGRLLSSVTEIRGGVADLLSPLLSVQNRARVTSIAHPSNLTGKNSDTWQKEDWRKSAPASLVAGFYEVCSLATGGSWMVPVPSNSDRRSCKMAQKTEAGKEVVGCSTPMR